MTPTNLIKSVVQPFCNAASPASNVPKGPETKI